MLLPDQAEESEVSVEAPCSDIELRLQVLHLTKEVLQGKAAMRWETHKQMEDITIDSLIEESKKLYDFVTAGKS